MFRALIQPLKLYNQWVLRENLEVYHEVNQWQDQDQKDVEDHHNQEKDRCQWLEIWDINEEDNQEKNDKIFS